jgi:hypothetical protein
MVIDTRSNKVWWKGFEDRKRDVFPEESLALKSMLDNFDRSKRVAEDPKYKTSVTPKVFDEQMQKFADNYKVINPEGWSTKSTRYPGADPAEVELRDPPLRPKSSKVK